MLLADFAVLLLLWLLSEKGGGRGGEAWPDWRAELASVSDLMASLAEKSRGVEGAEEGKEVREGEEVRGEEEEQEEERGMSGGGGREGGGEETTSTVERTGGGVETISMVMGCCCCCC